MNPEQEEIFIRITQNYISQLRHIGLKVDVGNLYRPVPVLTFIENIADCCEEPDLCSKEEYNPISEGR